MKLRLFNGVAAIVAVGAGLITLLGYFVQFGVLQDARLWLLSLVSLLAAWAVLAGALNLLIVHGRKFVSQSAGGFYSLFVLIGFVLVVGANLIGPYLGGGRGAASATNNWILTYLISTGGAALAGLIAFFLVFAGYRLLRRSPTRANTPPTPMMAAFLVSGVLAMLAIAPWPEGAPNPQLVEGASLRDLLLTITRLPAVAGARGLLLGIALGVVATGLRLLMGLDRPYGD